jgi:hypothetical protein
MSQGALNVRYGAGRVRAHLLAVARPNFDHAVSSFANLSGSCISVGATCKPALQVVGYRHLDAPKQAPCSEVSTRDADVAAALAPGADKQASLRQRGSRLAATV